MIGWKPTDAHLLLLSKFLSVRLCASVAAPYWTDPLGETAEVAIERFVQLGWLVPAPLVSKLDFRFKLSDLKPLLRERGLKVSGRKQELLERLIAHDREAMQRLIEDLDLYQCSADARLVAEHYKAQQTQKRRDVEAAVLQALKDGDFAGATKMVAEYEAAQIFQRGIGIDWKRHDTSRDVRTLDVLFTIRPTILDQLADSEWRPLRVAAGMMQLWGARDAKEWLPERFVGLARFDADTAVRMLVFAAHHQTRLIDYRKLVGPNRLVKEFRVSAVADSCTSCKTIAESGFGIDDIPELPNPNCTHHYGCRCIVMPVFDM